ncbi:MAG: hypothetical protein PHN57_01825 [Candidatus Omnitrophica bacterium]|nr:hypothetical protein [Candidatus Omnitrophota bacterium]
MIYLFAGQDNLSKDAKLNKLKEEFLPKDLEQFNLDTLYGKELTLKILQEKLLWLPFESKNRLLVIKNAQDLKQDAKDFLLRYSKDCPASLALVLDFDKYRPNRDFIESLSSSAVSRFKEEQSPDTFLLCRQIESRKAAASLKILKILLKNGEKPEKILGGLRASWERYGGNSPELKKKLKLLLECDIDIKTGRLKPSFALEKFIVNLCSWKNPYS